MVHIPLSTSTITRWIDEIAEDIEAELLERIESPWYTIQVDKSTNVDNKAMMLVFIWYIYFRRVYMGYVMCTFVANQQHNCRTIQVFEWFHIRKTELVILYQYMHKQKGCHDWMVFWFSLPRSKRLLLNVSLHTVSSIGKYWGAKFVTWT